MNNIIQSDIYRLRKGAAMRNTILGAFGLILIVAITFAFLRSGSFQSMMEESMQAQGATQGEIVSMQGDIMEMEETSGALPQNGAQFGASVMAENMFTILLLPIFLAVLGADYNAGTYRNTLSYEANRKKVYLGKFLVSCGATLLLLVVSLVFSWLIGGLFFGFGGFSAGYFIQLLTTLLLQAPIYLAILSLGHCLLAFTQKSGATVAVFLLVMLLYSSVIQMLAGLLPKYQWLIRLDFLSGIKLMASYQTADPMDIVIPLIFSGVILVGTFAAGMVRYVKADMH